MSVLFLCRICVSEVNEFVYLLDLYYGDVPASLFIEDILKIDISNNHQGNHSPLIICETCNNILKHFQLFYQTVKQAQCKYQQINIKLENDSKTEDILDSNEKELKMEHYESIDKDGDLLNSTSDDELSKSEKACNVLMNKFTFEEIFSDGKFILNEEQMDEMFNMFFTMRCEFCSDESTFQSYKELLEHSLQSHDAPSRVKCCNYFAKTQIMMETHILRKHIAPTKTLSLKAPCKVCGKLITTTGIRKHLINHLSPEKRTFKCQQCKAGFAKACLLKNHVERCHNAEEVKCELCHKMIRSKACLAAHQRRVHGPSQNFLCPECGKSYKNYENYTAHVKKHNGEEDKVKCPKCETIIKRCSLRCHLRRHEPDKKKQCPYCPHKATHGLSEHIKRVHQKLKRFCCSVCPMGFYSEKSLKDHVSSRHTGIPDYSCEFCSKTFMNSGNYHVHRKKMHPTQLKEKKLEKNRTKTNIDVPVYDADAPKKKNAQQEMEAYRILKDLQKKTRRKNRNNHT